MAFPATYNLDLYKGDTYEFVLVPKNSDGTTFSLSGYTAAMQISTSRDVAPTWTAQTVISGTNDYITCTITPGISNSLTAGTTYVYDVQIKNGSGTKVYTLITGNISVTKDVTSA